MATMPLTCTELRERGVIRELGRVFDRQAETALLIERAGLPVERLPPFGPEAPEVFWSEVCRRLERGLVANGLEGLLAAAADLYPGNSRFGGYARENRAAQKPHRERQIIRIRIRREYAASEIVALRQYMQEIAATRAAILESGLSVELDLVTEDEMSLSLELATPAQADRVGRAVVERLQHQGIQASFKRADHHVRVYYLDPLFVQGPDQQRFQLERIEASTKVRDVIESVMAEYDDAFFPADEKTGAPRRAVMDHVRADGNDLRLHPDTTLHDAGVRPGDTLRVSPDARAGMVHPARRYEALVVVRDQVREFAAAHPAIEVIVDDLEVPTEYVLRFAAPSYEPGDPPRRIEYHEVLVYLPPDFPVQPPEAVWQHPIFHPNIAPFQGKPGDGQVCLGDLQASYRPGLHFGRLCQMLLDMACFRSYVLHEGFNPDAATWILTEAGRRAIAAIGGRTPEEIYGRTDHERRPVRLRRLDA
jgi:ubiquitin-protein ligase